MDSLALLISPLGFWNLYTLRLRHVHAEGEEYAGGDFIDKVGDIDDKEIRQLVELCLWTQSDNLFSKAGRNFNTKKAFFEKADKTTQRYVISQVDQHITEAVATASRLGVHIFFAPKPGEWLKQQDELPEILCLDGSRNMVDLFLQKGREQFAAESLAKLSETMVDDEERGIVAEYLCVVSRGDDVVAEREPVVDAVVGLGEGRVQFQWLGIQVQLILLSEPFAGLGGKEYVHAEP